MRTQTPLVDICVTTKRCIDHGEAMEDFLAQIKPGSALELLSRVKRATDPPGPTFISAFDDHIASAIPEKLLSSNGESTLNRGDVIEIQGPACSGKTQLLQFFAMTCVLPFSSSFKSGGRTMSLTFGGRGKSVIVFDCDGRWQMQRTYVLLATYIASKVSQIFDGDIPQDVEPSVDQHTRDCLARIHIFRPTSSMSLATTLLSLPNYHKNSMPDQELLMVFIDSLSAFHHSDRWRVEEANLLGGLGSKPTASRADLKAMTHVVSALQRLRRMLGVVTFITNWALLTTEGKSVNNIPYDNANPFYGQHLQQPWPRVTVPPDCAKLGDDLDSFRLTHHITLPGTEYAIEPFPVTMSLSEAAEDEERVGAVNDGQVTGVVRTQASPGVSGRPEEGRKTYTTGTFDFCIRTHAIVVD